MLRWYIIVIVAAAAAAVAAVWTAGDGVHQGATLASVIAAGVLSERLKVSLFGDSHVSLSAFICMFAGVVGGATDLVIAALILGAATGLAGRVPSYKVVFNMGAYVLSSLAFLGVLRVLDASRGPGGAIAARWASLTAGVLAEYVVNAVVVGLAIALSSRRTLSDVVRAKFLWLLPHYLPLGALLLGAEVAYHAAGVWALVQLAIPVGAIQLAIFSYSALQRSYEARLAETEGRFERVQEELARRLGHAVQAGSAHTAA